MPRRKPKTKAGQKAKVAKVMREYKEGALRSGSKSGPKVKSRRQAVAIAMSEAGKRKPKASGKSRLEKEGVTF